jgi:hypothetical protein
METCFDMSLRDLLGGLQMLADGTGNSEPEWQTQGYLVELERSNRPQDEEVFPGGELEHGSRSERLTLC